MKIKDLKQYNALALVSFIFIILVWLIDFNKCNATSDLSVLAMFMGILSIIWILMRKEKGYNLALATIILGLAGNVVFITLCGSSFFS